MLPDEGQFQQRRLDTELLTEVAWVWSRANILTFLLYSEYLLALLGRLHCAHCVVLFLYFAKDFTLRCLISVLSILPV